VQQWAAIDGEGGGAGFDHAAASALVALGLASSCEKMLLQIRIVINCESTRPCAAA